MMKGQKLPATGRRIAAMADRACGFVPEDRRQAGPGHGTSSIDHNVALASLGRLQSRWASSTRVERALTLALDLGLERVQLKFGRIKNQRSRRSEWWQPAEGGARPSGWPASPSLLIIDEPTRGIDVGTKAEVHRILDGLVAEGMAVLMISSELPEVLGMADRVLVLHEGRMTAQLSRAEANEDSVMRAASGLVPAAAAAIKINSEKAAS